MDLYERAKELRDFAWDNHGLHDQSIPDTGDANYYPYKSYHFVDEIIYGSLWVAKASQQLAPAEFEQNLAIARQWKSLAQSEDQSPYSPWL